ncbi:hypothetical protein ACOSQ4_013673 [Xanthoceras sorbifolium]
MERARAYKDDLEFQMLVKTSTGCGFIFSSGGLDTLSKRSSRAYVLALPYWFSPSFDI